MEQKNLEKEKKDQLDNFLKVYARILLWIFIITITIATIYILIDPMKFCKQTISYDERYNLEEQEKDVIPNCKIIGEEEMKTLKNRSRRINFTGLICLIGMIVFNPDIKNNVKRFINKIVK